MLVPPALIVALVALLLVLTASAALMAGLWLGERGRRVTAELREVAGSPLAPAAERRPDAPLDAEARAISFGSAAADRRFSEETIRRGVEQIKREARELGVPISEKDAREQALAMLGGAGLDAPDLPELA